VTSDIGAEPRAEARRARNRQFGGARQERANTRGVKQGDVIESFQRPREDYNWLRNRVAALCAGTTRT